MKAALAEYLPDKAIDLVFPFLDSNSVHLKVTPKRSSKHGDYRPPLKCPNHRISINGSLNKYAFLITLVHEMAHLEVWKKAKSLHDPHGAFWKKTFTNMMIPLLENNIFPDDLQQALIHHLKNPKAASNSDKYLAEVLYQYDENPPLLLKSVPMESIFILNGHHFKKLEKLKTSYLCECLENHRKYRVSGIAEIILFPKNNK